MSCYSRLLSSDNLRWKLLHDIGLGPSRKACLYRMQYGVRHAPVDHDGAIGRWYSCRDRVLRNHQLMQY